MTNLDQFLLKLAVLAQKEWSLNSNSQEAKEQFVLGPEPGAVLIGWLRDFVWIEVPSEEQVVIRGKLRHKGLDSNKTVEFKEGFTYFRLYERSPFDANLFVQNVEYFQETPTDKEALVFHVHSLTDAIQGKLKPLRIEFNSNN